jgi:predicted small lipoprotein YifL
MRDMKLRKILLSLAIVFSLAGCGYDGHFRYPCQDPANWESEDCKPPICVVNGACPADLVGENVINGTIEEDLVEEVITNE